MTERGREIAAVLRAVLEQRHEVFNQTLGAYVGVSLSDDDLAAMARAVVERTVMPENTDCRSAGCLEDRVHALAKELGYMEELRARLARLTEALGKIALLAAHEPWVCEDIADAALADAGAGKERGDG